MYLKEQLILILNHSREEMLNAIQQVDHDQQVYPQWKIKEVLAHLSGWDQCIADSLIAHASGEAEFPEILIDPDSFNQQSLAKREALALEDVITDWQKSRQELYRVIEGLPEEKFEAPAKFPWGQVGAVEDTVRGFAAHERRHAADILKLVSTIE